MTLKKRLKISNFLMFFIPVFILGIVLIISLISVLALIKNNGFALKNNDFYKIRYLIKNEINEKLDNNQSLDNLINLFDDKKMNVIIYKNDDLFYQYGDIFNFNDLNIESDDLFISSNNTILYIYNYNEYNVKIFLNSTDLSYSYLKNVIIIFILVIFFAIILSVLLTEYFLRCFIIKKIEEPLNMLYDASLKSSLDDLDYKIEYVNDDEFKPIIDEFNNKNMKLKESILKLEDSYNERNMILKSISHDIKSPLTAIIGCVDGIFDGVADKLGKKEEYLNIIKNKCFDINKMVIRLNESITINNTNEKIDVVKCVDEFVNDNKNAYYNLGVRLNFINNNLSFFINCSSDDFKRCLSNICDNSYKYKVNDIVNILIECSMLNNEFILKIKDDGSGVCDCDISYIFNPFFRSDKSRSNTSQNNGLGLAIVKKIIESSNGIVNAYNDDGLCIEVKWRNLDV